MFRALQSHSTVTEDLDPAMRQVFSQLLLSHVRQMYERTRYAEPRLQRHVIKIRASEETAAAQPVEAVNQTTTSQTSAPKSAATQVGMFK